MANIPTGDPTPDITWSAVGLAITQWERLELAFACIRSIFTGKPRQINSYEDYGRNNKIWRERKLAIEAAASLYFTARPNQDHEGELRFLLDEAGSLAIKRHQLAHGILIMMPVYGLNEFKSGEWIEPEMRYFISPPWYSRERLKFEQFAIGSHEIIASAEEFAILENRTRAFAQMLWPET